MFEWLRRKKTRSLDLNTLRQMVYGPSTLAGVAISEDIALGITAVFRAVDLISSTIAGLDAEVYRQTTTQGKVKQPRHRTSLVIKSPNESINQFKFWRSLVLSCVCSGNGFSEIERDENNDPLALHLVSWKNVRVIKDKDGVITYRLQLEGRDVASENMIHLTTMSFDGCMGISPIRAAKESLGISVAADRHAGSVFGSGGVPRGFLKVSGVPNPETKLNIRESWDLIHGGPENSNKIGILGGDTEFISTNMTAEDCQLLNSRAYQIEEVARIFGVPVNLLFSGKQGSYNSNEEANLAFFDFGLRSLIENIEAEIDFKLLTQEERAIGYLCKYKVEEKFPRITAATSNSWRSLVLTGIATQNEARAALGLNPIEGSDSLLVPVNLQVLTDGDGNNKVTAGLSGPEKPPLALDGPEVKEDTKDAVREATRAALLNQIGRSLRRQVKSRCKGAEQRCYLIEALEPSFRAYTMAHDDTRTIEEFADAWVTYTQDKKVSGIKAEEMLCL